MGHVAKQTAEPDREITKQDLSVLAGSMQSTQKRLLEYAAGGMTYRDEMTAKMSLIGLRNFIDLILKRAGPPRFKVCATCMDRQLCMSEQTCAQPNDLVERLYQRLATREAKYDDWLWNELRNFYGLPKAPRPRDR